MRGREEEGRKVPKPRIRFAFSKERPRPALSPPTTLLQHVCPLRPNCQPLLPRWPHREGVRPSDSVPSAQADSPPCSSTFPTGLFINNEFVPALDGKTFVRSTMLAIQRIEELTLSFCRRSSILQRIPRSQTSPRPPPSALRLPSLPLPPADKPTQGRRRRCVRIRPTQRVRT